MEESQSEGETQGSERGRGLGTTCRDQAESGAGSSARQNSRSQQGWVQSSPRILGSTLVRKKEVTTCGHVVTKDRSECQPVWWIVVECQGP